MGEYLSPGVFVELTVSDTGCGMEQEVIERIFDPYYTTKPPGEGVGLGLATALGVVEMLGGKIDVVSEPGKGSRFVVVLPVASSEDSGVEDKRLLSGPIAGDERVLLIDDEQLLVDLTKTGLEQLSRIHIYPFVGPRLRHTGTARWILPGIQHGRLTPAGATGPRPFGVRYRATH